MRYLKVDYKKNKPLVILCIVLLTLSSCKKWQHKYPEDTEKTKVTPMDRLTDKWWTLQNASLNGVDYTDTVKQQFGKYQMYFTKNEYDPGQSPDKRYYSTIKTDVEQDFTAIWRFTENETYISIGRLVFNPPFYSFTPCYLDDGIFSPPFSVLKLTESELKFTIQNINKDTTVSYNFISG